MSEIANSENPQNHLASVRAKKEHVYLKARYRHDLASCDFVANYFSVYPYPYDSARKFLKKLGPALLCTRNSNKSNKYDRQTKIGSSSDLIANLIIDLYQGLARKRLNKYKTEASYVIEKTKQDKCTELFMRRKNSNTVESSHDLPTFLFENLTVNKTQHDELLSLSTDIAGAGGKTAAGCQSLRTKLGSSANLLAYSTSLTSHLAEINSTLYRTLNKLINSPKSELPKFFFKLLERHNTYRASCESRKHLRMTSICSFFHLDIPSDSPYVGWFLFMSTSDHSWTISPVFIGILGFQHMMMQIMIGDCSMMKWRIKPDQYRIPCHQHTEQERHNPPFKQSAPQKINHRAVVSEMQSYYIRPHLPILSEGDFDYQTLFQLSCSSQARTNSSYNSQFPPMQVDRSQVTMDPSIKHPYLGGMFANFEYNTEATHLDENQSPNRTRARDQMPKNDSRQLPGSTIDPSWQYGYGYTSTTSTHQNCNQLALGDPGMPFIPDDIQRPSIAIATVTQPAFPMYMNYNGLPPLWNSPYPKSDASYNL